MTVQYVRGFGYLLNFYSFGVHIPEDWTIAQIERYVKELAEFAD